MSVTTPTPVVPPTRDAQQTSSTVVRRDFQQGWIRPARLGDGSRRHDPSPGTDTSFPQVKSHQGVPTRTPRIPRILHGDDLDVSVPRVQSPKDEPASSSC